MGNRNRKGNIWLRGILIGVLCAFSLNACGDERMQVPENGLGTEIIQESQTPEAEIKSEDERETEVMAEEKAKEYEALLKEVDILKPYKGVKDTNPIISQKFGADPYAMVYGDRVYFYMTADEFEYDAKGDVVENTYGKIRSIQVVSTSDMVNFEDHGSVFAASSQGAAKWANNSWAPAAAWKEINGEIKFFLYFANSGGGIGVLTADSPTGPFEDPLGKAPISKILLYLLL